MSCGNFDHPSSRRQFLRSAGCGFGAVALAALTGDSLFGAVGPLVDAPKQIAKRPGKAKHVIFLFMEGGPSHLDTFDYKPLLNKLAGQPLPASFGTPLTAAGEGKSPLLACQRAWQQHGQSGLWISDWFTEVARHADDLAVIRSCASSGINHAGGVCSMNTGSIFGGRPSLGAWASY